MTLRALAFALSLLAVPSAVRAAIATQQDVEEALTCQCGCGLTVHSCNHLQCPSGEPMKKEIADHIAKGEDRETILVSFRNKYGEKVLSSPTFHGFNWFAWVTPFVAVLMGGLGIVIAVRRRRPAVAASPAPAPPRGDPDLRARLERELEDLDRDR